MTTEHEVLGALAGVRDPEIDEPLTDLRFVGAVRVDGASVTVRLRLPTYFCAPNFAYLMVEDARAAVAALSGVAEVEVALDDHFASDEINAAVGGDGGFETAFPGETSGELEELRDLFSRKALTARQGRMIDRLLRAGRSREQVAAMRVADLEPGPDAARCLELRRELGLDASLAAPAIVTPEGERVGAEDLERYLRVARLVRVSLEGNAGLCRALLKTRYGIDDPEEVAA
ncbi:MAG: iron-sulfur cluster assembly protein [Solirubrobacteraceae bacterium]